VVGLLKSASARAQVWEECRQVLDLQAEETRQDQTRAAAPDLVEVAAQALEWAECLAPWNEEKDPAFFSDAVDQGTDAGGLP
jgi:hypothetical protein